MRKVSIENPPICAYSTKPNEKKILLAIPKDSPYKFFMKNIEKIVGLKEKKKIHSIKISNLQIQQKHGFFSIVCNPVPIGCELNIAWKNYRVNMI